MKEITLATTTSAQDSGLLARLLPKFETESGYRVNVKAVGSGRAMDMARKGQADVLLVHDPDSEKRLLEDGAGTDRKLVMHNDFVLAGPGGDPAKIRGSQSITDAFKKISDSKSAFVSRGDASGTDKREKAIWQRAGISTGTLNYQETKGGMAETLAVASGKKAYVLTDRATFLSKKHELDLEIMVEGDDLLLNMYHVILVSPGKFPGINAGGGKKFADFLVGPAAQEIIGSFMKDTFGHSLFVPDAGRTEGDIMRGNWRQMPA